MGNKKQLIDYLKINYRPGSISWVDVAKKFGYSSPETVRSIWKIYRKSNGKVDNIEDISTSYKEGNFEDGSFKSTMTSDFDPKSDKELADLHKVDIVKYRIKNYWSKKLPTGKFVSSVFCVERRLGDAVDKEEIIDAIDDFLSSKVVTIKKATVKKSTSGKSLLFFVADEHVGASVTDGLYDNEWNEDVYADRKSKIINIALQEGSYHGKFDELSICNLGDTLDGFSGYTTRGGHKLEQSVTNKQAISTYLKVNSAVWYNILENDLAYKYKQYNVENSNHGGLGWDSAANIALNAFLTAKYGDELWESVGIDKIIGSFNIYDHSIHLTHGKDEKYMKRNLPLHLDAKTESFLKEYLEQNGYDNSTKNHFFKGDLHKFATEQGKYFSYTNVPSLFGSSAWVMANFGKTAPGLCYAVVEKGKPLDVKTYWYA